MSLILKSPDNDLVRIKMFGICRRCKHYHPVEGTPDLFGRLAFDWETKHRLCELEKPGSVEFLSPARIFPKGFDDSVFNAAGHGPQWLDWKANADVKLSYVADTQPAITSWNSLASSPTFIAGAESAAVTNSLNYIDFEMTGLVKVGGTALTANTEIRLYYLKPIEDTPTWGDAFTGTDAARSVQNANEVDMLVLGWAGAPFTTINLIYPIQSAMTIAQAFGFVPKVVGTYITHNTGQNLGSSGHQLTSRGLYATVV